MITAAVYFRTKENSDRKIKRSIIDILIGKVHIFPLSTFLCNACAKFGEQCISYERDAEEGMRKKKKFSVLENIEEFIDEINNNNLSPEQVSSLTYALGSFIKPNKYCKFIL